jgi:hypothetical protein
MSDTVATSRNLIALHLTVNNHPGVMSHVCGLFARRAFNLEGILVAPSPRGELCSMWLLVNEDGHIPRYSARCESSMTCWRPMRPGMMLRLLSVWRLPCPTRAGRPVEKTDTTGSAGFRNPPR